MFVVIVTAYNNALLNGVSTVTKRPPTMVALEHPLPPTPNFDANAVLDMISGMTGGNAPKRERFVFRPNHLDILELTFQEDNYPSHEKREDVAKACNAATEMMCKSFILQCYTLILVSVILLYLHKFYHNFFIFCIFGI